MEINSYLESFDWGYDLSKRDDSQGEFSFVDDQRRMQKFRYVNDVPLNDSHKEFKVNFLEYGDISENFLIHTNPFLGGIIS